MIVTLSYLLLSRSGLWQDLWRRDWRRGWPRNRAKPDGQIILKRNEVRNRMSVKVLALDLERTLVSDAMSAEPRPGLFGFLTFCCERFARIALFTSVETAEARDVLEGLAQAGCIPSVFIDKLEYIDWTGEHKDLGFVPGAELGEALLVDDDVGWVPLDQREWWIRIAPWDGGPDNELIRVQSVLDLRMCF